MSNKYKLHRMRDGTHICVKDMTDSHLKATIRLLERKAIEGVVVRSGGGSCAEDFWYDEELLFGQDALDKLNFQAYIDEFKRRQTEG